MIINYIKTKSSLKNLLQISSIFLFFFVFNNQCLAQISPPGLGNTNTAFWFALGLRQNLDSAQKVQSITYIGMGRKSSPNEYNPFSKQGIWIFNQEFSHTFHKQLQYSLAISYRRQDEYSETAPYEISTPAFKQEFRIYGRFSYILNLNKVKMLFTARQEFRKFFAPDFSEVKEIFQLRTRARVQVTVQVSKDQQHKLVGSGEVLFATSKKQGMGKMTNFAYTETRLNLYYSFSPRNLPLVFNIGYMNNLVGLTPWVGHYLAFDIIVQNPFTWKKPKKQIAPELQL